MTRVKVCGLKRLQDARAAIDAGADAIGLNFVAGTPREVDEATAREISRSPAVRGCRGRCEMTGPA